MKEKLDREREDLIEKSKEFHRRMVEGKRETGKGKIGCWGHRNEWGRGTRVFGKNGGARKERRVLRYFEDSFSL